MVARLNSAHRGTNFFDHAGSLVTEHHWSHRYSSLPAHHMIVSAAKAYGCDTHQNLGGARQIERDVLDRHRCADATKYCSKQFDHPTIHLQGAT